MMLFAAASASTTTAAPTAITTAAPEAALKCNVTTSAECEPTVCCIPTGVKVFGPKCEVVATDPVTGDTNKTSCRIPSPPCAKECDADYKALDAVLTNSSVSLVEKIQAYVNNASDIYDESLKAVLSRKEVQKALGNLTGEDNFAAFFYVRQGELTCNATEYNGTDKYCEPKTCCGAKALSSCVAVEEKDEDDKDEDEKDYCTCDRVCDEDDDSEHIAIYTNVTGLNPFLKLAAVNLTFVNETDVVVPALRAGLNESTLAALEAKDDYFSHAPAIGGLGLLCALLVAYV